MLNDLLHMDWSAAVVLVAAIVGLVVLRGMRLADRAAIRDDDRRAGAAPPARRHPCDDRDGA